ncbi:alcohol dehydrogenase catalytic domain-containing protein [Alphaproteobacteria bacterium KMM 3653]|uniref:Alcohol dehydrogenase catalytic domain-containing protein n=1 Tax=Harenicola maris TaxID=2841044 RepID=A0AAP2CQ66_9RHOB|nr:alcohol dehydrogenase catalytic domain-containing protein [Harenicola maris]
MTTVKAAVCNAFNEPLSIENVRLRAPEAGEVMVTLEAVAICHSDISFIDGGWGGTLPAVYGHEAVGHVTSTGAGTPYAKGDRVLVTLIRSCGSCPSCGTGAPAYCETPAAPETPAITTAAGIAATQAMNCGAFAEAVVVHHSQLAPVPESIPAESACLLSCGVITGTGAAVNTAGIRPGETVVVVGAGGVGLNAIQGARIAGAGRIVAVDMTEDKLDAAMEFGATDGILATAEKPWKALRAIAPRMADVVMVCVGAIPAFDTAPRFLGSKGRMYMVGMPHTGAVSTYEPVIIAAMGQAMVGTKMGDTVLARDIPWMVDMYQQGRLKLDELVSGRWTLDQINEAIADTKSGAARRNVILF